MTENLNLTHLREVAEKVAFHEPDFKDLHEYLEALRIMQGELSGTTLLALIERVHETEARAETAEESHLLADEMLRAVLEALGTGPETDPIIKAREVMARLEAAEAELERIKPLFENYSREYPNECNKRVSAEAKLERVRELNQFLPASIMERITRATDGGDQK